MKSILFSTLLCSLFLIGSDGPNYERWEEYLGGPDRNHYSALTQINTGNVNRLQVAWTYEAPDTGQMQMSPIIVDGVLYGVTAGVQAFALDAATGKEIWRFGDPLKAWHSTSRGVSYWSDGKEKRILFTAGPNLWALNATTGKPIESFGKSGAVDLHEGLPRRAQGKFIISNTPGTIFENLIVMPVRVSEGNDAAPGDIRAFDVVSGKLVWTFHTIPYPNEPGMETWENKFAFQNNGIGGANNWAGMAVDREAGILFVPTGSAAPDFYGNNRKGDNLYANCLLALDARTGKRLWHYQFTHHDIWDRDLPAPPNLLQVKRNGAVVDAVAQITKQGFVFVFDRKTGAPLFDIKEMPVPASSLEEEQAAPTQPVPVLPRPFARQSADLTEKDLSPYAPNKKELLNLFNTLDKRMYAPPSLEGALLLPGYDGGAEWGGAAADPADGILYVNSNEMAWMLQMQSAGGEKSAGNLSPGGKIYQENCASCHQPDRSGLAASGFPSLLKIQQRSRDFTTQMIEQGKGMMPGFPQISGEARKNLLDFLYGTEKTEKPAFEIVTLTNPNNTTLYQHTGYHKFLDSNGLPGIAPPWGTLSAIDLNTGEYRWRITLGDTESLREKGNPPTGCENYGGPVSTAGGLLFIAATKDGKFRAFDKKTGALLWETTLPAAGFATPATYEVKGKQYVVVACGGEKLGTPKGNKVVAFSLQ